MSTPAANLRPGTKLRHKPTGALVVLDRRKHPRDNLGGTPFWPGWWLRNNPGGLADFVIDAENSDWEVVA